MQEKKRWISDCDIDFLYNILLYVKSKQQKKGQQPFFSKLCHDAVMENWFIPLELQRQRRQETEGCQGSGVRIVPSHQLLISSENRYIILNINKENSFITEHNVQTHLGHSAALSPHRRGGLDVEETYPQVWQGQNNILFSWWPKQREVCLEMPRRHLEELLQAREVRGDVVSR